MHDAIQRWVMLLLTGACFFAGPTPAGGEEWVERIWATRYDRLPRNYDNPVDVAMNTAGEVWVAGDELVVFKHDSAGRVVWHDDQVYTARTGRMLIDADDNVYICGCLIDWDGIWYYFDIYVMKYFAAGGEDWYRQYPAGYGGAEAMAFAPDGNLLVAVWWNMLFKPSDPFRFGVMKVAPTGEEIKRYDEPGGSSYNKRPTDIAVDEAGNVYLSGINDIAGRSAAASANDVYQTMMFTESEGRTAAWLQSYDGPNQQTDEGTAVAVDEDGNAIVTGRSKNENQDFDIVTIKYDHGGAQLWLRRYDGPGGGNDAGADIAVDGQGNILVVGTHTNAAGDVDALVIKYDPNGETLWSRTHDGGGTDGFSKMFLDPQDCLVGVGETEQADGLSDLLLVKLDPDGGVLWSETWDGGQGGSAAAVALDVNSAGEIAVAGRLRYAAEKIVATDFLTVKYRQECDGCFIDFVCRPAGEVSPDNVCAVCDPENDPIGWSPAPGDTACDDGLFCNGADTCLDGACDRHAGDPCASAGNCDEDADACVPLADDDDNDDNDDGNDDETPAAEDDAGGDSQGACGC